LSSSSIKLIVGLANPGKEYTHTRHNAGAWFVDDIANAANAALRPDAKFHGLQTQIKLHDEACQLLIPTTFMNNSGRSVQACMNYRKLEPREILIAHDDIDLPAGVVRLKFDGGDGGHNGLKDIISHLNTKQFYRLRIGVGRPLHGEVVDYVLTTPSKADRQKIDAAIQQAHDVLPLILQGELAKAMQALHTET
jgi:PTH1 family peptidyl-tRNA hydrolase